MYLPESKHNPEEIVAPVIGVDIGGRKIASGVLYGHRLIGRNIIPTPKDGWRSVLDSIIKEVGVLKRAYPEAQLVGVGVPGALDAHRTEVIRARNIHGFQNIHVVSYLSERLGCPVNLENDANAAALAESRFGVARNTSSSVFISVSTGIGAGVILDGKIWRGFHGFAGEIGKLTIECDRTIMAEGGAPTLENVASGTAIERNATLALRRPVSTIEAFRLAEADDPASQNVVKQAMLALAKAIANVQLLLDPQMFVIGGGVASAGTYFFDHLRQFVCEFGDGFSRCAILPAQLGIDAGAIGAAIAARESELHSSV